MAQLEDLTGREFGFLKVISRAPDKIAPSGQKRRMWTCKCLLCGNEKIVSAQDLKRGTAKSCGCYVAIKGKAARNKKICVICGKEFDSPPSSKTVTCSIRCRQIRAAKSATGREKSIEEREKISKAAVGRDMTELQAIGTEAAAKSPHSGRFETNVNAKDWHLVSPEGKHYHFHSLNFWMRENGERLFGCKPDSRGFHNAVSGLRGAKRATQGKETAKCCTYKGWRVIPTDDDDPKV